MSRLARIGQPLRLSLALAVVNIAAWCWALLCLRHSALLLGTALLAYGLGLRHAVDADHIAAIDNATRRLLRTDHSPAAAGLYFAIGHSGVVVTASLMLALAADAARDRLTWLSQFGGEVGTLISAVFLFTIAAANALLLRSQLAGGDASSAVTAPRGVLTRLLRPVLRLVTRSWHMLPLGALFALGFDTASEVGVLALSAAQSIRGVPLTHLLVVPVLFATGMALVDTLDSALMARVYGWALEVPARRRGYDLTMTGLSIAIALSIGTLDVLGLLADRFALHGPLWRDLSRLGAGSSLLGCALIAALLLVAALLVSLPPRRASRFLKLGA